MLKYSIQWRPPIWGRGQFVSAIAEAVFDISPPFFCKTYFLYISPSQRKMLGFKISFYPPKKADTFGGIN